MGKKQVIGLIIALVILGGLIGGWLIMRNHDTKKSAKKDQVLVTVNAANVNSYSYTEYGTTTSYEKKKDKWTNPKDKKEKVDTKQVQTEVTTICNAKKYDTIKKTDDYSQYGLTVKSNKVTSAKTTVVLKDQKKTYKYYVGITNPYDKSHCYVMIEGDKNVYITDADAFTSLGQSQDESNQMQMNGAAVQ